MNRFIAAAGTLVFLAVAGVNSGPTTLTCPASDQTSYTAAGGDIFTIECGIDHYGGDLKLVFTNTFNMCLDTCTRLLAASPSPTMAMHAT
jgi:hypothetical protein